MSTEIVFRYPDKPIVTTPDVVKRFESAGDWLAQDKYDGFRVQIYFTSKGVELLTRVANPLEKVAKVPAELTAKLAQIQRDFKLNPSVAKDIATNLAEQGLPAGTVLDGEFVGPRGSHQPCVYLFDILAASGQWLTRVPYIDRWNFVKSLPIPQSPFVSLAHTIEGGFLHRFEVLKDQWVKGGKGMDLCEGLVLKRKSGLLDMSATSSVKSKHVFKLKFRDVRETRY